MSPPIVLTIAGSDPSGSSGLQADLPTIAALGGHATSVITVVTAQDSLGIKAFHEVPLDVVLAQLDHLVDDLPPAATKTGLLFTPEVVAAVVEHADGGRLGALVVDPVMVDSAGRLMVTPDVVAGYRELAGKATVLTPNQWEAELLVGHPFVRGQYERAAEALVGLGCELVVVTGGRGNAEEVLDVTITPDSIVETLSERVGTEPIRGTGCTFSAALATLLGHGETPLAAAERAHEIVLAQLRRTDALRLGAGRPGVPHSA